MKKKRYVGLRSLEIGIWSLVILTTPLHGVKKTSQQPQSGLSLQQYLSDVKNQHADYKAAAKAQEAAKLSTRQIDLTLSPTLFGNAAHTSDAKPSTLYQLDRTKTNLFQIGVRQQSSIGLSGSLYYNVLDLRQEGLVMAPGPAQNPHFVQASPVMELAMPLWRNFLGAETKKQRDQTDSQVSSIIHEQNFRMKSILTQAEATYWQLALARESVRISQDAYDRQRKLVAWHKERAQTGLADRVDLIQAEAALQNSVINLKMTNDNENLAARDFNLTRSRDSNQVPEHLAALTTEKALALEIPKRSAMREDVKAAQKRVDASASSIELTKQKLTPNVELYGSFSLNNTQPAEVGKAYARSFSTERPTTSFGVRINMFLDRSITSDLEAGQRQEKAAQEDTYQRRLLEQESEWSKLTERFQQTQEKVALFHKLEAKQKEKYEYERDRRNAGRTTTQQVLLFEYDYEQAQYGRIQALSELLFILAKMKLYQGDADEPR